MYCSCLKYIEHKGVNNHLFCNIGGGCDTYSASQSQNMNFSPSMRPRPTGPTQQNSQGPGQPPPLGMK